MSEPQQTLSYESPRTTFTGVGIGTIALQLVGVYCMTLGLPMLTVLATFFGMSGRQYSAWQALFSFVPLGMYIVMGVLLIRFAAPLSMWLFRDTGAGIMSGAITTESGQYLQAVAFSVVGVVLMINAAPRLVSLIWLALMDMGRAMGGGGYGQLVEPMAQFLLGLGLFLQSKGLSLLWHRIRTGGVIAPTGPIHTDADKA